MEKSEAYKAVIELLRLRRWAVGVLSRSTADPGETRETGEQAWHRFLSLERCACALLERLIEAQLLENLSIAARSSITSAAATETQSALTARAEARELATIASRAGFPIVVLKGGVNAVAGKTPAFPLVDIDLLVRRVNVDALVAALASAGFGTPAKKLEHHQGLSPSPDRLAIEVHWTTHDDGVPLDPEIWNRLQPIDGLPPLQRLGAADHLTHLIEHAVVVHRERSVSLRDTILIGQAARDCSEEDLRVVRNAIATGSQPVAMTNLLDFAIALDEGNAEDDPFTESCATFYSAITLSPFMPKALSSSGAMAFVLEQELGRIPRLRSLRNSLKWRGTGNSQLAAIADRLPFVGHAILAPAHLAYYAAVAAYALPSIRSTRDRALGALGR